MFWIIVNGRSKTLKLLDSRIEIHLSKLDTAQMRSESQYSVLYVVIIMGLALSNRQYIFATASSSRIAIVTVDTARA